MSGDEEQFLEEFMKYDKDGSSTISKAEAKEYFKSYMARQEQANKKEADEDKPESVYES